MFTNVSVVSKCVTVNGKQLCEVSLPNHIDRVIADSGTDECYEFLKEKKVIELTGPLVSVKTALKYFIPRFVNIDRVETDEQAEQVVQIALKVYIAAVRSVGPNVNVELFKGISNLFLPTSILTMKNQTETKVSSEKMLETLISCKDDIAKKGSVSQNYSLARAIMAENLDKIIKDFCERNDTDGLVMFRTLNRIPALKFAETDKIDAATQLHCTADQLFALKKLGETI